MSIKGKVSLTLAGWIIRYRWIITAAVLVLLIPAWFGLSKLKMDSSNESFMPKGDPVTKSNDRFKEIFGSEEFFFILVETDNIWTVKNLAAIDSLAEDIELNLPFVDEVMSVTTADIMSEEDGFLLIETMRDSGLPQTEEEIADFRSRLEASALYRNRIISGNPGEAGILVSLKPLPDKVYARAEKGYTPFSRKYASRDKAVLSERTALEPGDEGSWILLEDPRKAIAATLLVIMDDHRQENFALTATGMPVIDRGVDALTGSESGFFGLLSLLAAAVILFILYKDFRSVASPLLVFIITAFLLFGLMGWLKMTISIMTIVLVPLLLVISVGYSVHIMNGTRRFIASGAETRLLATKESLTANLWPCFLSALTTAGGFLSFLFVPMVPIRDLGFQCGVGTMLTFFLSMTLVPALYIPGRIKNPVVTESKGSSVSGIRWIRWNDFLFRHRILIGIVFGAVTVVSVIGALRIKPSAEILRMIGERAAFVKDTYHVSDRMGGAYSAEFLITLPEAEMAKDPAVLKTLAEAGEKAKNLPDVKITFSLADMVTELDRVLGSGSGIPADRDTVAQYLLLYEMSGGDSLSSWTDLDYKTVRFSVVLGGRGYDFDTMDSEITTGLKERLPAGSTVIMTGDVPVLLRIMSLIVNGQIISCMAALGFIALLLILILRSIRLGFTAIIPNIFPVVTTLGLMGLFGWSIDFVTVMVAPMLIGIAVDDTIHFFVHYREHRMKQGGRPRDITEATFRNIGNSLVFTSIILAGGFVLFSFSKMESLQHMGILAASGIASALLADLAMSPLLIAFLYSRESVGNKQNEDKLVKEVL